MLSRFTKNEKSEKPEYMSPRARTTVIYHISSISKHTTYGHTAINTECIQKCYGKRLWPECINNISVHILAQARLNSNPRQPWLTGICVHIQTLNWSSPLMLSNGKFIITSFINAHATCFVHLIFHCLNFLSSIQINIV